MKLMKNINCRRCNCGGHIIDTFYSHIYPNYNCHAPDTYVSICQDCMYIYAYCF